MHVLLVATYELGHQPFNLASPAAHLLEAGHEVDCLDLSVQPFDDELVRRADMVAFSTPMHTALMLARRAAKRVRVLNPQAHICFYGLYAGMHGDLLLQNGRQTPIADSILGGEFEASMLELLRTLDSQNGRQKPPQKPFQRTSFTRQRFSVPARHLLPPLERYTHLQTGEKRSRVGYIEASRGCAHKCLHCPITPVYNGRMRIVPRDVVLADIRHLVDMGAEHITFGDPDFLNGLKHSLAIVREMHRAFPHLTFDFTAKIEHILEYRELFPELRNLGCLFMVSAIELLNDRILAYLDKGHTRADVQEAVRITREADIALRGSLMPFTPWTSAQDLVDLIDFVDTHNLHEEISPVQYSIRLLVPPGSSLLERPQIQPFLSGFNEEAWTHAWRHPDPRMDELQEEIAGIVEGGSVWGEDEHQTFEKIRRRIEAFAGHRPRVRAQRGARRKKYSPRLTEDWFC